MIPIHLKIAGIYSYREQQEIDFQALTAAHLFGIFGPVGSGKSAILEAIMFALYGETERLNNRELRAYNMMNLRVTDAFIQFDFLAPDDKGQYRALVKGKRNTKNKEDVKFERSLYRISGSAIIPVDTGEITSILGISYENFRRTIIIPQGKFQEFLQLGARDRTEMVKELFSLHRFDLSFKTSRLQKDNDDAVSNCQGHIQQLGEVAEEAIVLKTEELNKLSLELDQTRFQLKDKETAEVEMQRLKDLQSDLHQNRNALKELDVQKEEIQKAEQRLNDYDECVNNFKSDLELLDNQKRQHEAEEVQFSNKLIELNLASLQLREVELRFALARQAYDLRESLLQQAKELEIIAKINTHHTQAVDLAKRIENGEKLFKEASLNWESQKDNAKVYALEQESIKSKLPDINRLQQAKDWFARARLLKERFEGFREKEVSLKREFSWSLAELSAIALKHEIPLSELDSDFSVFCSQLISRKQEIEKSIQSLEKQLLHLEVQDKLKSLATEIKEGEPCPLCGSTIHPQMLTIDAIEKELQMLQRQKELIKNQNESLGKDISHAVLLLGQRAKKQPELDATLKALSSAKAMVLNHENTFSRKGLTEEMLLEEWQMFTSRQQEIEKLNRLSKEAMEKAEIELGKVKDFSDRLEGLRIAHGKAQQNMETLLSQLSLSDYAAYETTVAEILLDQSRMLRQQYSSTGVEYAAAEKMKNAISADVQILSGSVENMKMSLQRLCTIISALQNACESRIHSSRFANEAAVREILALQPDRLYEQKRIQHFRETVVSVTKAIQHLEQQLEGKAYEVLFHETLRLEISILKTVLEDQNRRKGAFETVIRNMKQALEESLRLKADLVLLTTRRENLKTLADMFRGQGFVNFVSTLHLQNLVNSANDRFYRLTRQQLKLELDPENNFRIRDYLNEGQWRNVKTLSGGQTFQASLCLALALADNIQQLNQNGQNFFFLDEGFGTLDHESLVLVFETLKTLRLENRVVGIISHVEDLQQEIAAWLNVTRDDDQGSRISRSWDL